MGRWWKGSTIVQTDGRRLYRGGVRLSVLLDDEVERVRVVGRFPAADVLDGVGWRVQMAAAVDQTLRRGSRVGGETELEAQLDLLDGGVEFDPGQGEVVVGCGQLAKHADLERARSSVVRGGRRGHVFGCVDGLEDLEHSAGDGSTGSAPRSRKPKERKIEREVTREVLAPFVILWSCGHV